MQRVSEDEFNHWMAFDRISPISRDRFDVLAAGVAMAATAPYKKKGASLKLSDFMPNWGNDKSMSGDQMEMMFTHFAAGANKRYQ